MLRLIVSNPGDAGPSVETELREFISLGLMETCNRLIALHAQEKKEPTNARLRDKRCALVFIAKARFGLDFERLVNPASFGRKST